MTFKSSALAIALAAGLTLSAAAAPLDGALSTDALNAPSMAATAVAIAQQQREADTLHALGLLGADASGYDLTHRPSRVEAVSLLVNLTGSADEAQSHHALAYFSDVADWARQNVDYANAMGWLEGTAANLLHADDTITANSYATMLLRYLGYDDAAGDFAVDDAAFAISRMGIVQEQLSPDQPLYLHDLFALHVDLLNATPKNGTQTILQTLLDEGKVSTSMANALGLLNPTLSVRQVYEQYQSAIFALTCYETVEDFENEEPMANASGFFISPTGLAVTNHHSISGARYVTGTLSTGETFFVERVIYHDAAIDIAVVQMSLPHELAHFNAVDILPRDTVSPGDICHALSNPLGLGIAITSGLVSDTHGAANGYALPSIVNTADISEGSSGGLLLNATGQAIGVTSGAYSRGNSMYLAVPLDPLFETDLTVEGITLDELYELDFG